MKMWYHKIQKNTINNLLYSLYGLYKICIKANKNKFSLYFEFEKVREIALTVFETDTGRLVENTKALR